jgi:hypothetical protein
LSTQHRADFNHVVLAVVFVKLQQLEGCLYQSVKWSCVLRLRKNVCCRIRLPLLFYGEKNILQNFQPDRSWGEVGELDELNLFLGRNELLKFLSSHGENCDCEDACVWPFKISPEDAFSEHMHSEIHQRLKVYVGLKRHFVLCCVVLLAVDFLLLT